MADARRVWEVTQELSSADNPLDEAEHRIESEVRKLTTNLVHHRPERVIELARLACLPWAMAGQTKPGTEGGLTKIELLGLIALTTSGAKSDGSAAGEVRNALYLEAHEWAESVGEILNLLHARLFLTPSTGPTNDLAGISMRARLREVWIRNTSYPDMVQTTHDQLFGIEEVSSALTDNFGFDASDAFHVLTWLHDLQVDAMDDRMEESFRLMAAVQNMGTSDPSPALVDKLHVLWNTAWQPTADLVAVSSADIAAALNRNGKVVEAVLNRFTVDVGEVGAREVVDNFIMGDNPFRTNPVIRTARGQYMLVHPALIQPAIRENLEQSLKALPVWENYQKWRGSLLEDVGRLAFERILPGARTYSSFDYFVPANETERLGGPSRYTKKVEGDLFFVLDDVAVIVEAKAAAVTPAARAGETRKLRRNLTDIISKASAQAARLQRLIEEDRGVVLHSDGWLDLGQIREIHTVALSLEDLPGVATATGELVTAGLIDSEHIPWVVSIHDLQVIVDLVDRPAEFLLYLRRRRDPEVAIAYDATDELDFFLYFFEKGLNVVPHAYPTAAERPRTVISSRTEVLDAWHSAQINPTLTAVEKPTLMGSPMVNVVDELQARGQFGWLSLGATLLSGSAQEQTAWSSTLRNLLSQPVTDGMEPRIAVSSRSKVNDSWLLVWMTRPVERGVEEIALVASGYLRDQILQRELDRGAVLIYDEGTKKLINVVHDGALPLLDSKPDRPTIGLIPAEHNARISTHHEAGS